MTGWLQIKASRATINSDNAEVVKSFNSSQNLDLIKSTSNLNRKQIEIEF
jgi:hypothetical protein